MKGVKTMTNMYDDDDREYEQYDDEDYKYGKGYVKDRPKEDDDDFEDTYWMWRIARR